MSHPKPSEIEISQEQALDMLRQGVPVYDIRPSAEQDLGSIESARSSSSKTLQDCLLEDGIKPTDPFLVCCMSGVRSLEATTAIRAAGFEQALSIAGGYRAWSEADLPCDRPAALAPDQLERYARHLVLPGVGPQGQATLSASRILLLGAGGLGSPAALYLAAAGVGYLGIVDDDNVERSNLQRQILHNDADTGKAKTTSAKARIEALNPDVEVTEYPVRLTSDNARSIIEGWDLVLDGSDNLPTRYLVNEVCVNLDIPLVYGAAAGFEGQAGLLHPGSGRGRYPCYRCLFPGPPGGGEIADCNTAGVLGVVPGVIGLLQATEAIKQVLGLGRPLLDRMLLWDALQMEFRELKVSAKPDCPVCAVNKERVS